MGRGKTKDERQDLQRQLLDRLVLKPSLKAAARELGLNPTTPFRWIRESMADPETKLTWMGQSLTFADAVAVARRMSIVAFEHEARSLGMTGHETKLWHDGKPVYVRDPQIEADAISMTDDEWATFYGNRDRSDTFARDEQGRLIQATTTTAPNAQLVAKLLSSIVPGYQERSEVSVTHSGSVWIEGQADAPKALSAPSADFAATFGLTARPDEAKQRPTNVLAVPRPCVDSAEFDSKYRKKLLREVVLFRDQAGKLLPPLPDDVLVAGSVQARAFEDAGLVKPEQLVHPTTLIDEGYQNDWLLALAPGYKPKFTPPSMEERVVVAQQAAAKVAEKLAEKPGMASARADSERLGRGTPPRGGRRVQL